MNTNQTIFLNAFFASLSGSGIYDTRSQFTAPTIDLISLPERKTLADDWAAIGADFKKVMGDHEKTASRATA